MVKSKKSKPGKKSDKPILAQTSKPDKTVSKFPIVGIGASAGGLEALKELLQALPLNTGMAFILIQHLDPTHDSLAPEILSRSTQMPVHEVKDGMRVEPNHVYMIPPNADMSLLHDVLTLLPMRTGPHGQHLVIDSFLQSLALDQKGRGIGVILSGTASDGTLGLKAIKSEGGLAIAQDPKTARYSGMPESAIASGFVDLILSPKEIAQELARISKHPYVAAACELDPDSTNDETESKDDLEVGPTEALRKIFVLLRAQTQVDFTNYKHSTIMRRIQRRMMVRKSENIDAYAKYLRDNPNEVKALFADILIHVTEFFRDPKSFNVLKETVFPELIKNKKGDSAIRIWVPGCSTGEEAYSIAILLLEFLINVGARVPIQIFATDISEQAIQKARSGVYSQAIESTISKERINSYFEKIEGGYKINKAIRDLCLFSKHDVTHDPPFSKLDLVSCRNVLIYFAAVLQKRVIPVFHYALNPGGFLFLGRSESLSGYSKLFALVDKTNKIYSKEDVPTPMTLRTPLIYDPSLLSPSYRKSETIKSASGFQRDAERITLSRYAPASVVINTDLEILQFQGRTAPCLETFSGAPTNKLFKMARQEITQGLRATIQSATKKNGPSRLEGLSFNVEGKRKVFNIEVVPVNPSAPAKQRNYVIFFEEASSTLIPQQVKGSVAKKTRGGKSNSSKDSQRIYQLEDELSANREAQKALSEEFETAQEELTSANEELQSANEELQSTNEELETSKEELQSSNEELTTVNDELQNRNSDLIVLSSDLNNVLNNVEIPVVIVGSDRRIRRFTPKAEKIFNLIASDIGRLLSDLAPKFESNLEAMVSNSIKSLSSQESEVQLDKNLWMRLQVRPYRTVDDRIDGAVITLVDITALKEHLTESQKALNYATTVADTLTLPLVVLDERFGLVSANKAFSKMFKLDLSAKAGSYIFNILDSPGWRSPRLQQLFAQVASQDQPLNNFEIEENLPELGPRILLLSARKIHWRDTMPKALLLSIDDITERRMLERAVEQSEERFRRVVESAHDAIIIVNSQNIIEFANPRTFSYFGYAPGELVGKSLDILIPERVRGVHAGYHEGYMVAPEPRPMGAGIELFGRRKDGSEIPVDISLTPIKTGSETRVTAIIRDISETKKLSNERKTLLDQEKSIRAVADHALIDAEAANATKDVFLATLSHELRTPLTSILSYAQLLQRDKTDPGKIKQGLQTIEQSAKTQGQLIDDLLDISRIQSGKLSITLTEVDPREAVKLAITAVRHLAEKKQIIIESEMKLNSEKVSGDIERLQQIVWNLLTNAIKFSSNGDNIEVRVEPVTDSGKKFVSIKVIDHGKGIKPDFLPKLFERFSQADSSSVRAHGGLGLGLALVRDLTRLQGGMVRAESEGLDKGSTFTVFLPVKSDAVDGVPKKLGDEEIKKKNERPDLSGLCVMIVEDDSSTMDALNETLTSFGAKTIQCNNVAKALEAFTKTKPDILVSDIAMPGEDGYNLIRKIRELGLSRNGDIPSLALSAYAREEDRRRALTAGFTAHMAKPFDSLKLGRAVLGLAKRTEE